jgi:hypothetical protein
MKVTVQTDLDEIEGVLDTAIARGMWIKPFIKDVADEVIKEVRINIRKAKRLKKHPITLANRKSTIGSGSLAENIGFYYSKSTKTLHVGWKENEDINKATIMEFGMSIGLNPTNAAPSTHWRASENNTYEILKTLSQKDWDSIRSFFYANGIKLRNDTKAIYIPATPIMGPAVEKVLGNAALMEYLMVQNIMRFASRNSLAYQNII